MIQLNNISKAFSGQVILEETSFLISKGEKIGLVGRNGTGKSTIFRMIQGDDTVDSGEIVIPKNYRIGALDQHISFSKPTVLEECMLSLSEDEQYDHYKAEKILSGLGFSEEDFHKDPHSFSGGYQVRISLTKALLKSPDLLLLDEPTNYLDIISIRWLKKFLKSYPSEMMIITHDKDFMDSTVTHVVGIKRHKIKKIKGQTSNYYEQIELEEILHEQAKANLDKKRQEIQGFVDKFRASASKAAQAQSKLKQLEKMGTMSDLKNESQMSLRFPFVKCPSKELMSTKDISFQYSPDSPFLFENLSLNILKTDRVAIIGKNGKGKSTLLNNIARELTPNTGEIKNHPSLQIGHFGQTNINRLDLEYTIAEEIHSANPSLTTTQVRSIAGSMMFSHDSAEKKIKVLSGGERSRVLLGKILANPSNLLLLDEPTNHLDIESVEQLTTQIKEYPGAVVFVTHNEMMLSQLANKIVVFHKNKAEVFNGTYAEFLEKIGWEEEEATSSSNSQIKKDTKPKLSYKERKHLRSQTVKDRAKAKKPITKVIDECESLIEETETELSLLQKVLVQASEEQNAEVIQKASQQIKKLEDLVEEKFELLEVKTAELEKVEKEFEEILSQL